MYFIEFVRQDYKRCLLGFWHLYIKPMSCIKCDCFPWSLLEVKESRFKYFFSQLLESGIQECLDPELQLCAPLPAIGSPSDRHERIGAKQHRITLLSAGVGLRPQPGACWRAGLALLAWANIQIDLSVEAWHLPQSQSPNLGTQSFWSASWKEVIKRCGPQTSGVYTCVERAAEH